MDTQNRIENVIAKTEMAKGDLALAKRMNNPKLIAKRTKEVKDLERCRKELQQTAGLELAAKMLLNSRVLKVENDDDIIHLEFSNGMRLSLASENFRESDFIWSNDGGML